MTSTIVSEATCSVTTIFNDLKASVQRYEASVMEETRNIEEENTENNGNIGNKMHNLLCEKCELPLPPNAKSSLCVTCDRFPLTISILQNNH